MTGRGRRPTFIPLPTARRVMRMGTYGAHQADGSSAKPGRGRLPPRGGVFSGQRAKEGGGVTCSHIDLTPYLVGDIYSVSAIVGGRRVPRRRRPRCVREYSSRSRYSEHRRDGLDEVDLTARINPLGRPAAHRTLSLSRRVARCVGSADRRSIHHVDASESTAFGMTTPPRDVRPSIRRASPRPLRRSCGNSTNRGCHVNAIPYTRIARRFEMTSLAVCLPMDVAIMWR